MYRPIALAAALVFLASTALAQDHSTRLADLDRRLAEARVLAAELQGTIAALTAELQALQRQPAAAAADARAPMASMPAGAQPPAAQPPAARPPVEGDAASFHEQVVRTDLATDERGHEIQAAPELFVQTRFQALAIDEASPEDAPTNFELTRMETRWAGRLAPRVGMGFELQYHPAPDGASFEIINDAFVEYYPTDRLTVRVGQFVKPFGFDIQHSSGDRESPERGIFAGYFFPGQRDRGAMLRAGLGHGVELYLGAFNGNRFFTDRDRTLNYNGRLRKVFETIPLAVGVSAQVGRQLVPEGMDGDGHENLFGADLQWAWRRLGVRAEWVTGDRPSTLLELEPEFAPAYAPGAQSSGGALFSLLRLTDLDQIYGRYDQFNGDPVYGYDVRAFNMGYLRRIGDHARLGVDYQFKNRLTANDDSLNSRLQITFNVER